MKQQHMTLVTTAAVAVLFALILGAPRASGSTLDQFLYCTGGNTCLTSAPGSGTPYWKIEDAITLDTTLKTFDFTLTVTGFNNGGTLASAWLQDFSAQYFFGNGADVTSLAWKLNPGAWTVLQASKAGNSGTCQGNATGAFCGAVGTGNRLSLGTSSVILEVTGDYAGTFLQNNQWNFQLGASKKSNGTGGNTLAISLPVGTKVPDGGMTLTLLGGALVGLATLRQRFSA